VRPATKYFRLTSMANYLEWLCQILLMDLDVNQERISVFIKQIEKRRPVVKKRNALSVEDKGLNEEQIYLLLKTIQINSDINPFITDVQVRNRLMILILYTLGIRCGELLNLQITDIDFHDGSISIRRRADEKSDPRRRQPLVKTLERKIELSDVLLKEIRNYMLNERRK
ncbi:TPA: tyrosine-type recombinase/integrase, partial [Citrobacter freundii]|nr:tyrosine-type recombinase/integrase [Citrobacter freundii]